MDLKALEAACDDTVVGMMLTQPELSPVRSMNMLRKVIALVHGCGGLDVWRRYNFNPLLGIVRPGDLGFDVMHFNFRYP